VVGYADRVMMGRAGQEARDRMPRHGCELYDKKQNAFCCITESFISRESTFTVLIDKSPGSPSCCYATGGKREDSPELVTRMTALANDCGGPRC
jgi:hypothetical protein